jgi:hypothetical protein
VLSEPFLFREHAGLHGQGSLQEAVQRTVWLLGYELYDIIRGAVERLERRVLCHDLQDMLKLPIKIQFIKTHK